MASFKALYGPALYLLLMPAGSFAEIELTPFTGLRAGGGFDVRNQQGTERASLEFEDAASVGLILNVDLDEAGKQAELYYGRQSTTASRSGGGGPLLPNRSTVEVVIHQLQFGGLFFPGGQNEGGFVSGVVGLTRMDPEPGELRNQHRASIAIGGGYKAMLGEHIGIRADLRGIYTVLDSGGGVFCSGGCALRVESSGFVQFEAGLGLVLRF